MDDVNTNRIDISKPRYDQNTFWGRAKHFSITTDPRNLLASNSALENAKKVVTEYRAGKTIEGLTEEKLWAAKHLYDSAYHPQTGEKTILIGRMSAQVPMNMSITGCMLTFYKKTSTVIFWQWFNQTFNAVVNYSNRSGEAASSTRLGVSYLLATIGAMSTALVLNKSVSRFPPIVARFVPFTAVAAANCINIPCMRTQEMIDGIPVFNENGQQVGDSKKAAATAIGQVTFSRISMAAPPMLLSPIVMNQLEKTAFFRRYPLVNAPAQVLLVGFFLVFSTPLCCAFFPQNSSLHIDSVEKEIKKKALSLDASTQRVYFNKGL